MHRPEYVEASGYCILVICRFFERELIIAGGETKITVARMAGLFCLFLLIAWGLGYPTLNRYDPRQTPGLTDVQSYAALVTGAPTLDAGHLRFRVLVPWVARPFYQLAKGRFGSWDPVMFGLLVADALFVAGTALLIVVLGTRNMSR